MMKEAREFTDLRAKAEKGDAAAKVDYFVRAAKLGHFKLVDAKKQAEGLKLTPEQKKEVDGLLTTLEVRDNLEVMGAAIQKDQAKTKEYRTEAGRKFWKMHEEGRIPTEDNEVGNYYSLILLWAEEEKNVGAFEKSLDALKAHFGPKLRREFLRSKEEILEKMKEEKTESK